MKNAFIFSKSFFTKMKAENMPMVTGRIACYWLEIVLSEYLLKVTIQNSELYNIKEKRICFFLVTVNLFMRKLHMLNRKFCMKMKSKVFQFLWSMISKVFAFTNYIAGLKILLHEQWEIILQCLSTFYIMQKT